MSDSQKFSVAAHALAYLVFKDARGSAKAVSSAELASSMPTNPVVVRRVTAMLARAGIIGTRAGASGGAWLKSHERDITLDKVLKAVNGATHLGVAPKGASDCPIGARLPGAICGAMKAAESAAADRLSHISIADLMEEGFAARLEREAQAGQSDHRIVRKA